MNSQAAEDLVEEQALVFEQNKDYLLSVWDREDFLLDRSHLISA